MHASFDSEMACQLRILIISTTSTKYFADRYLAIYLSVVTEFMQASLQIKMYSHTLALSNSEWELTHVSSAKPKSLSHRQFIGDCGELAAHFISRGLLVLYLNANYYYLDNKINTAALLVTTPSSFL